MVGAEKVLKHLLDHRHRWAGVNPLGPSLRPAWVGKKYIY
jgi:hypothetical protein